MKEQVLSIEQMKHLQELGVDTSKASCAYYAFYESEPNYYELRIRDSALEIDSQTIPFIPTFTLQDMLEMLPPHFYSFPFEDYVEDYNNGIDNFEEYAIKKSEKGCLSVTDVLLTMIPRAMFGGYKMPNKITEQEAREIFDYIKNNIEL